MTSSPVGDSGNYRNKYGTTQPGGKFESWKIMHDHSVVTVPLLPTPEGCFPQSSGGGAET